MLIWISKESKEIIDVLAHCLKSRALTALKTPRFAIVNQVGFINNRS